jgi:hypothetical protein
MRTRAERRALTERYQKKQSKIHRNRYGPYDDPKRRDKDGAPYHESGYSSSYDYQNGLWSETPPSPRLVGHWRRHAVMDCGRAQCQMCLSPRRTKWASGTEKLTIQERKALDSYRDGWHELVVDIIGDF